MTFFSLNFSIIIIIISNFTFSKINQEQIDLEHQIFSDSIIQLFSTDLIEKISYLKDQKFHVKDLNFDMKWRYSKEPFLHYSFVIEASELKCPFDFSIESF